MQIAVQQRRLDALGAEYARRGQLQSTPERVQRAIAVALAGDAELLAESMLDEERRPVVARLVLEQQRPEHGRRREAELAAVDLLVVQRGDGGAQLGLVLDGALDAAIVHVLQHDERARRAAKQRRQRADELDLWHTNCCVCKQSVSPTKHARSHARTLALKPVPVSAIAFKLALSPLNISLCSRLILTKHPPQSVARAS